MEILKADVSLVTSELKIAINGRVGRVAERHFSYLSMADLASHVDRVLTLGLKAGAA